MNNSEVVPIEVYQALKKEYDQFSYIISHDLSAPLRHIDQFSSLLLQNLADHVGDEEKEFTGFIKKSVLRSQSMLDGLLCLSRITTEKQLFDFHDMSALAKAAIEPLSIDDIECDFKKLESVYCDGQLITQLFTLLLENACKFKHKVRPLQISISGQPLDETFCLLKVKDNGIGIINGREDAIFDPFQKLDTDDEYSGAGMGLTYCRKIAHLHNGTIASTSIENQGSLFSIMLPLKSH